jgi:tRNA nucleotidyltransferase (CCA-adding enzyme)
LNEADKVLQRATRLVTPADSEVRRLEKIVTSVREKIEDRLDREDPKPEVSLGGSYARGTWLKGSHDVDFFVLYPPDYPRKDLESRAIEAAKEALNGYRINLRYAEHPYVEAFVSDVRINVVPCYAVLPGQWQSAADRSPYHTKYIKSRLDDRLRLEARLFKKFAKASGVYGAEVKIQGFSGYVCEVLTLKFGSFLSTLGALSRVKPGEILSLEEYDADLASSFRSPLVILDPVDTTRNLGSAISVRNVGRLAIQSWRFLSHPALSFFHLRKLPALGKLPSEILSQIVVLSFRNGPRSPDILWGELNRSCAAVTDKLGRMGYKVLRSAPASDEKRNSALLFLFDTTSVPSRFARPGPEYFRAEDLEPYFEKNRDRALLTWVGSEGRLESLFERNPETTKAESAVKSLLQKINIDEVGLSPRIKEEISQRFTVASASKMIQNQPGKNDWLSSTIADLATSD